MEKLDEADLRCYLKSVKVDATSFLDCAYVKGVVDLLFNPFYLIRLAGIYAKDNDLSPKNQLMDRLITETFDVDDQKFSGELDERYLELFSSLESLAVAMQLMHRQSLDDRTFLDLTELPAYIFDKNKDETKYAYLRRNLPADKLNLRLSRNVTKQRVKDMALKDHIDYFDRCKDASIAEYALGMCKDSNDTYLRSIAWRYLYNTLGAEYVASEILPVADEKLLLEISDTCKDISREMLRKSMEREYEKTPSIQLQAHLITYGSSLALGDYVKKVMSSKKRLKAKAFISMARQQQ